MAMAAAASSNDPSLQQWLERHPSLSHLSTTLSGHTTLDELAAILVTRGRVCLLSDIKGFGVAQLADRQRLANEVTRAVREGLVSRGVDELPADFAAAALRMPIVVRKLLVDHVDPASISLDELGRCAGFEFAMY